MKRILIPILGLAVVGGLYTTCLAAADQIYISNHLYTGRAVKESGTEWFNLDDFIKALGLGPASLPHTGLDNGQVRVTYNKKTFEVPAETRADGLYIDGRRLVEGMGGRWIFNSSLGLTDIAVPAELRYRPVTPNPGTPTVSASLPAANASPSAAASGSPVDKTKSPLKIDKFTVIDPTLPGNFSNVQVHGTVAIENTAEDFVDGIQIIVHIQDGYDNDITTVTKDVGELDGGKTFSWDWSWSNSSALLIHPRVEVVCNPLITKAEREKMAKDHTAPPDAKKLSIKSEPTEGIPASSATTGGVGGGYNLAPQDTPTPTASNYAAPTETSVPPGFNPGDTGSPNGESPSSTATNPPGF